MSIEGFLHSNRYSLEYADKQIIGAVAAMSLPSSSYELAEKSGLLVLTQSGENISLMNPPDFAYKGC